MRYQVNHYQMWGGKEVIDLIKDELTTEEYIGYLKGNILKYRMRAGKKTTDPTNDINKALDYEETLRDILAQPDVPTDQPLDYAEDAADADWAEYASPLARVVSS